MNGQPLPQTVTYNSNYYSNKGTVYINPNNNPTFNATQSDLNAASYYVVTGDRTQYSSLSLLSDTNGTIGSTGTTNIRGWTLSKTGTAAYLDFDYINNDTSGQSAVGYNTLMRLNGVAGQLEFPLMTNGPLPTNSIGHIVWGGDTDLYRVATGTLRTDGLFQVGSLSGAYAVVTDSNRDILSSITTATEISYVSGVTSSIQNQLNNKISFTGGTLSGPLILPDGSSANPSLEFVGSLTTGLSSNAPNTLSLNTNGSEAMHIDASQNVYIDNLNSVGVVHTNVSGELSTSLIVNADISASAGITDSKLATISTAGKVANSATTATNLNTANAIVSRDSSGNFVCGTITGSLNGNATSATSSNFSSTATYFSGSLFGDIVGTQSATVVSEIYRTNHLEFY